MYSLDSSNTLTDLQEVMLPWLPGYKVAIFTCRLVTFNQTFEPLGFKTRDKDTTIRPLGVIWHHGIAGHYAGNIASTYIRVLKHRHIRHCKISYVGQIIVLPKIKIRLYTWY